VELLKQSLPFAPSRASSLACFVTMRGNRVTMMENNTALMFDHCAGYVRRVTHNEIADAVG
jgi:hypothetical protein